MFSRPGAKDTEDDLLRLQEKFVTGRLNPAAAVFRSNTREESRPPGEKRDAPCAVQVTRDIVTLEGLPAVQPSSRLDSEFPPKKKSRFKTRHQETFKNKRQDDEEEMDCEALLDVHDRHVTSVLYQIQEKDIGNRSIAIPRVSERGFPMVLHRGNINEQNVSSKETGSQGRRSLFAQQFAASDAVTFGVPKHQKDNSQKKIEEVKVTQADSGQVKYSKSSLISGEGLTQSAEKKTLQDKAVDQIHKENVAKLEAMTHEEIMEEQTRIKSALDPNLVAFLTSRHKKTRVEAMDTTSKEEKQAGHQNTNISTEENISHVGKHVHFSENSEMIKEENGQNIVSVHDKQSSEVKKIGDVEVSSKWLHMDTVEYEKLEWIKDCPPPNALESKEGNQARFDFNGCLVSKMDNVPVYLGLHHHGKDPSSPGYTLEELCILARSSFLQQRVLALQVLAKIIREYQMGAFQGHLDGDVLSVLLDAGTLFLLRWSLDDSTDAVMAAAIQGLAAILIVPSDKDLANKMFGFPRGQELPALCPVRERKEHNKQVRKDEQEDEKNLTDAELLKQDVVKGLIQMSLLPRIRYVLEVCHPSVVAVHNILDILTRISQHSTHAANEVLRCPRLMETIFTNFLPLSWRMSELETGAVYGIPSSDAMRLVRTVCCAGRHMAATLISKYNLSDRLMRNTALSPRNMQMKLQEAYFLYTESLRTWRVCILYGLGCDAVRFSVFQYENLCLLSGAFAGLAAFYSELHDQVSHSPVETLQQLEQLASTVLHPLIEHHVVDWCFTQISSRSAYTKTKRSKLCRKAIPSLPDLGSIELVNRGTELAESHRPELIAFTSCTIELMYHVTKLHRGITHKFSAVLSKKAVLEYLKLVVESQVCIQFFFYLIRKKKASNRWNSKWSGVHVLDSFQCNDCFLSRLPWLQ
ncbi:RNA polymerase II-associated protein 1-like [Stylophora pistillata]|uniref:RNA polymerase II-associated protein 1-like n=1 Tax=Stylophora pistillata TaxID=50429 RepID=UPI000C04AB45|nr:RNA polymerase II-associated protein 1-like [Stylophora pistillata]